VLPPEQIAAVQVIPATVEAHLDDVAGELLVRRPQLVELGRVRDAPAVRLLERIAVHIGHEAHSVAAAHRAVVRSALTDVAAGAQQLGVRVAHIATAERAAAQVSQDRSSSKRVVDVSRHGAQCMGASRHSRDAVKRRVLLRWGGAGRIGGGLRTCGPCRR
jgi:hypothetical protein